MLTEEQEKLLLMIVEADRNLPGGERRQFRVTQTSRRGTRSYLILHQGFPEARGAYCADLDELEIQGFIRYSSQSRVLFDVRPIGYQKYRELKERNGNPLAEVESSIFDYLDDASFQQRFPIAYEKWTKAVHALNATDADKLLTQIGHDCREAIQELATALVNSFSPPNVEQDKARTKNRIRAVLHEKKGEMGEKNHAFLDALFEYWSTVSDLVQRQEHGAQKVGDPLVWEDARRVVFQTGVLMFELDRTLHTRH